MRKKLLIITMLMIACFTFFVPNTNNVLAITEAEIAKKEYEIQIQIENLSLQILELQLKLQSAENKEEIQQQINQLELEIENLKNEKAKLQGTKVDNLYYRVLNEEQKTVAVVRNEDNKLLTNVNIPSQIKLNGQNYKVTSIGESAFSSCTNLKSVNIPNSITNIGSYAFMDCVNLTNIIIPNSVTNMSNSVFVRSGITSISLPNTITTIDTATFGMCNNLKSIVIPSNIKYINDQAFYQCENLTSITIPKSVQRIATTAFDNSNKVVIKTYKDSKAEAFAKANVIPYVLLDNDKNKTIDIAKCTISKIANQNYTGKAIKPNPTIKNGKVVLKNGTDYTVGYKNNTKLGTATVTIKGKGNYTGTITKTFKIVIGKVAGVAAKTQTTSSITLKWNKPSGSVTGYEVYMATSKKGKYKKVATITKSKTTTYKKTKLSAGKTYYFKVRAYKTISGKKKYGSYSSILTTTTKTKTPSISKVTAGNYKITIKWKRVTGATGYEIYMATSKNGKYKKIKTITKGSTTSYTKTGLTGEKTYYFKIRTYKTVAGKKLYSGYSSKKSAKAKAIKGVKLNTAYKNDGLYPVKLIFTSKKKFKWQNKENLTSGRWVTTFTGTYTVKGNKVTVTMSGNKDKKYLVIDNKNNTFWLDPKIYTDDSI